MTCFKKRSKKRFKKTLLTFLNYYIAQTVIKIGPLVFQIKCDYKTLVSGETKLAFRCMGLPTWIFFKK